MCYRQCGLAQGVSRNTRLYEAAERLGEDLHLNLWRGTISLIAILSTEL